MTSLTDWNNPPPDGWTIDDLDRLADGARRPELIDGVVPVGPHPGPVHQAVVELLCGRLGAVCPAQYGVTRNVEVRFSARRSFVPDISVVRAGPGTGPAPWLAPREVLIAVEVVAPTSLVMDRITKPALYAAAGIPYYWRVETDGGVEVSTYRLDLTDEVYRQTGEFRDTIDVPVPWPIKIPIAEITP